MLLASCGGKTTTEKDIEVEDTPWFGKVLNSYRELWLSGKGSRQIERDMSEIIAEAKQKFIPVYGSPYGISCSKAVINTYNVQDDCINIIMELVPDEGTDFHLDGFRGIGPAIDYGPYGKTVQAQAYCGEQLIYARSCHCSDGKMLVTLIIDYDELEKWKPLDQIHIVEKR